MKNIIHHYKNFNKIYSMMMKKKRKKNKKINLRLKFLNEIFVLKIYF
jgi:hypothetical protein